MSQGTEGEDGYVPQNVSADTAAESFIRDGLSKVMKITNICAIPLGTENTEAAKILSDCGLPDKITRLDNSGTVNLSSITSLLKFNNKFSINLADANGKSYQYEQIDTKAAAFETVNGESILVYYSPNCEPDLKETEDYYPQSKMCANFIYDLNGKKGPNAVGKDIGFISAMYSTDPVVVAPNLYPTNISDSDSMTFEEASLACRELQDGGRLPTADEASALFYNRYILFSGNVNPRFWTSTLSPSNISYVWMQATWTGKKVIHTKDAQHAVRCVKR